MHTYESFKNWMKTTYWMKTTTSQNTYDNSPGNKFSMQDRAEFKTQQTTGDGIQHALGTSHVKTVQENTLHQISG